MSTTAKFCECCGKQLEQGERFCSNCGNRIEQLPLPKASAPVYLNNNVSQIPNNKPAKTPKVKAEKTPKIKQVKTAENKPAKKSPKKRSLALRIIAGGLAAAILVVGIVHINTNQPDNKPPVSSNENILSSNYIPDSTEIAKITPATAAVSNTEHKTEVSGLSFDFYDWNIENEQDTLEVRDIGTVNTSDAKFQMYDFSLKSGQSKFLTDITITIPRAEGEEDAYIEWYDPEQKKWRPTIFDISEDEKSFLLYTDHFSTYRKITSTREKTSEEYNDKFGYNIFDVVLKDSNGDPYPHLQQPIQLNYATLARLRSKEFPGLTDVLESEE